MPKSQKFFLAATLLGGGYCVALLLGSLNSWIVPQSADRAAAVTPGGELVPMTSQEVATTQLTLIPVAAVANEYSAHPSFHDAGAVSPAPIPVTPLQSPTWLASTAGQEESPRDAARAEPPPAPGPIAKVSDVTPWGPTASAAAGSPWDRWPQWDPSIGADDPAVNPALDVSNKPRSSTIQASYHPLHDAMSSDDRIANSATDRTHIVVDGDSLAKLADRYLDDPQLANDIYEANRGVLSSPELLPIGVELQIPNPQLARAPRPGELPRTVEAPEMRAPNRFEPADSWLDSGADVPRAQLLQPVPLSQNE